MRFQRTLFFALIAAGFASLPTPVLGGSYIYNFGNVLRGGTPGAAAAPWLTAEFTDVAPGQVRMTFTASNLAGREHVTGLLLNLNPALNPCLLVFNQINAAGSFRSPRISVGANAFRAGIAGQFDLRFQFSNRWGDRRQFGACDQVTYLITGIPGLTAASFGFSSLTVCDQQSFFAVGGLNGLAPRDGASRVYPADGFTPVPEPSISLLLGSGLATFGVLRLVVRGRCGRALGC